MKYPDGTLMQCGDLIWWNEGRAVGFVQMVVESEAEYSEMNLTEPNLFISALHPFDPEAPLFVAYPEHCFADEDIAPFSASERDLLRQATVSAHDSLNDDEQALPYSVTVTRRDNHPSLWKFSFYNGNAQIERQIERQIELMTERLEPCRSPVDQ